MVGTIVVSIKPLILLYQSKNWSDFTILSDEVNEDINYFPSKYKGYRANITYYHNVKYQDDGVVKNFQIVLDRKTLDGVSIRKNPNTMGIFVRVQYQLSDFVLPSIIILGMMLCITFLVADITDNIKKRS